MNYSRIACLYIVMLFWSVGLKGCGKPEAVEPPVEPQIKLVANPTSFTFDASGGVQSLAINSNGLWRIDFDSFTWCRPSIQTSFGNATVSITADPNPTHQNRTAIFPLSAQGAQPIAISITQAGKVPDLDLPGYADSIPPDNTGMRQLTSFEFAKLMTVGWNLGNSLEAITVIREGVYSGGETTWGNPATTKNLIDSVKAAGFNTIRIPVSWSHKLEDPVNYKISKEWLERVEEVVNYVIDNGMFAKINIHWDGGWKNQPFYRYQDSLNTKLEALWMQIAIHFRNYDDRLLFAGTNEVHVAGQWGAPSQENANVQNSFNQTFIDAVRSTGGRNTYRHLVVQSYNTNIDHAVRFFVMPHDPTANRIMTEIHFYDPWEFALLETGNFNTQWGLPFAGGDVSNWGQEAWVDQQFARVKTLWIDRGVPVLLGEYGAIFRTNLVGDALVKHREARNHYLEYVTRAAINIGMVPIYWDNGHLGNNGFGLFNRNNGSIVYRDALDAIMRGAGVVR